MAEEDLGDLKLPEDNSERDTKSIFEENREMTPEEKEKLKKQKEFEYKEVEGRAVEKEEEEKEAKKGEFMKFVVGGLAILFLVFLYLWLVKGII